MIPGWIRSECGWTGGNKDETHRKKHIATVKKPPSVKAAFYRTEIL